MLEFNKYQTPLTDELLLTLPDEVKEQLIECITTIPFIKNLISVDRPYYKDLHRDSLGRAIVDITNPPIMTDADYFRQPALHFMKHECYSFLKPNSNPNSEYRKYWDRELDRCYNGLVREEDGAWITGYHYWLLNYQPMMVNIIEKGRKKAIRKESFPFFFEGINYRYHYLYNARESGKHAIELAKRGCGKAHPYDTNIYTPKGLKKWGDLKIGDKVFGDDGEETTIIDIPFDDKCNIYKITLKDNRTVEASEDHLWKVQYKNIVDILSTKQLLNRKDLNDVRIVPNLKENLLDLKLDSHIKNIEYIGVKPAKCITIDNKSHCYLVEDFITTHNSYSLSSIMGHNLILGESKESQRRVITVLTAYQKEYLKDDKDGTLSKFKPAINFAFANTPFPRLMLKNSPNEMSWQMGYKDEYGIEKGSLNQVLAVSAKDDPGKLRGKRGWILYEEMGNFKDLLSLYDITRKSVEDGDYTFACQYLVGTASEKESDFTSAKTLLYYPEGYNILSLPNVYDRPKQGKPTFGFFFPSYINRAGCYNKDGVSDVTKALIEILLDRYKSKYSADPQSVLRVIAEDPITPAEAIIKVKNAYFPITALTERLSQIDLNPSFYNDTYIGNLILRDGKVEYVPTSEEPIRKFGVENTTKGAIEFFNLPEKDSNGKVVSGRYIVGHDPVDNDSAESSSLSSTIVLDLWTDKIVAEYTGRQSFADDNFELVRLLCLFYNAKCLYESNKKGCFAYFSKMNSVYLLADTPEYLRDKQLIKYSSFGSNAKGVNVSAAINNYANDLIRNWLLKPVTITLKNGEGEDYETTVPNLFFIKNRALIEELIAFNPEINVDRIRALGMIMLCREEKMILYNGHINRESEEKVNKDYLGNDDYFTKNYDLRYKR